MSKHFSLHFSIVALSAFVLSMSVSAQTLTTEQKLSDLHQVVDSVESAYGPLEYKRDRGISTRVLLPQYEARAAATKTNGEFYYLLNQFIAEFNDGHFGGLVPTTRRAVTGLATELVQGKVLVNTVDLAKLPLDKFNLERGDEILEVDGLPVLELVKQLQQYRSTGYDLTRKSMMTWALFNRNGAVFPIPTAKSVKVTFKKGTSSITETKEIPWILTGKELDESTVPTAPLAPSNFHGSQSSIDYGYLGIHQDMRELLGPNMDRSYMCNAGTRIKKPEGATVIMEKPFVAYYYASPKGNLGYLRIPDYMPQNEKGEREFDLRFAQYQFAVSELEKNTVGLVIDQDHNCGGSVDYLHQILTLFMDKDFAPTQFQMRASKAEYLKIQKWVDSTPEFTLERKGIEAVLEVIKASWIKGDYLSPKVSITGETMLSPNRVRYTKPILMLVDFFAGSGGDAFPSMLQGLGRSKLLGTRTSGLGGHVEEMPMLNYSGFSYRMTKSLFFRPDGTAVENNGAVPNIDYEITRDDFMYEYVPYRNFYTAKLLEMINP